MSRKGREVVLEIYIDKEGEGKIKKGDQFDNCSISELVTDVSSIITDRLPADLADIFGVDIKTRVIGDPRYGSISIFFGVVLSGFTVIASYKSFFDSIKLIEEHCQLLIRGLLQDKYRGQLFANVSRRYPKLDDPRDMYLPKSLRRFFGGKGFGPGIEDYFLELSQLDGIQGKKRDGFFWFLLSLCIILLIIVGILVYAAVVKTYFP